MSTWPRRLAVLTGALAIVLSGLMPRASAAVVPPVVGGVALPYLPAALGQPTDFGYDHDDVDVVSRVWESRATESAYGVDLDVTVMRGARLRSASALRRWFVAFEQRDPAPTYRRASVHGSPGWRCPDQLFWLVRPGLAVSVQIDTRRFSPAAVARIARAARPPARR